MGKNKFAVNDKVRFRIGQGSTEATVLEVREGGKYLLRTAKGGEVIRTAASMTAAA